MLISPPSACLPRSLLSPGLPPPRSPSRLRRSLLSSGPAAAAATRFLLPLFPARPSCRWQVEPGPGHRVHHGPGAPALPPAGALRGPGRSRAAGERCPARCSEGRPAPRAPLESGSWRRGRGASISRPPLSAGELDAVGSEWEARRSQEGRGVGRESEPGRRKRSPGPTAGPPTQPQRRRRRPEQRRRPRARSPPAESPGSSPADPSNLPSPARPQLDLNGLVSTERKTNTGPERSLCFQGLTS